MTDTHQETADGGRKSDGGNDDFTPGIVGRAYGMGIFIGAVSSFMLYLTLTALRELIMTLSQDRTLTAVAVGVLVAGVLMIVGSGLVYFVVRAWVERNSEGAAG